MIEFIDLPAELKGAESELCIWLKEIAKNHNRRIGTMMCHFVKDEKIVEINRIHLNHDYPTDIITFGYEEGVKISGEIYIGIETVIENASHIGVTAMDEICRVISHGLLHLVGYNDEREDEKREMREAEEKCLVLRPKNLRSSKL